MHVHFLRVRNLETIFSSIVSIRLSVAEGEPIDSPAGFGMIPAIGHAAQIRRPWYCDKPK